MPTTWAWTSSPCRTCHSTRCSVTWPAGAAVGHLLSQTGLREVSERKVRLPPRPTVTWLHHVLPKELCAMTEAKSKMSMGPAVRSNGRAHTLYGGLFAVSRGRLWTVSSNSYLLESRRRLIWTHSAYFWQSESIKMLSQAGNGPIMGSRRLPSGNFVPKATAKLYASELTAHHSPSTFFPNQISQRTSWQYPVGRRVAAEPFSRETSRSPVPERKVRSV